MALNSFTIINHVLLICLYHVVMSFSRAECCCCNVDPIFHGRLLLALIAVTAGEGSLNPAEGLLFI